MAAAPDVPETIDLLTQHAANGEYDASPPLVPDANGPTPKLKPGKTGAKPKQPKAAAGKSVKTNRVTRNSKGKATKQPPPAPPLETEDPSSSESDGASVPDAIPCRWDDCDQSFPSIELADVHVKAHHGDRLKETSSSAP